MATLLHKGADIYTSDDNGLTPLHVCGVRDRTQERLGPQDCRLLLLKGAGESMTATMTDQDQER